MLTFLTAILLVFNAPNVSQSTPKFTLSGKLLKDARYYGGAQQNYNAETNTFPSHDVTLQVVRFDKGEPKVVGTIPNSS